MEGDFIRINEWLTPLSWLYGMGVGLRNMLFDMGVLKERAYDVPVISVGNITVGGTGKTPHVEYLIGLLHDKVRVAVLSRGYKRKSRGFLLADSNTPMSMIGDEPYQMKQKYKNVVVAVDHKRTRGIEQLTSNNKGDSNKEVDVILLDDAFQHRYVKPGINILLVDYHRLIIYDKLLPAGRLREPLKGKNRADIVIVTKCPKELKPMNYRVITKAMNLYPYQQLYFTTLQYEPLKPVFKETKPIKAVATPDAPADTHFPATLADTNVLLLTGIASPKQLTLDLKPHVKSLTPMAFSDHHNFSRRDVKRINEVFETLPQPRCIVTTEKDATRLTVAEGLSDEVRSNCYMLPVRITFMLDQEDLFNDNIIGYVRKNSRNSILAKAKDASKSKDGHYSRNRPRTISFRNN